MEKVKWISSAMPRRTVAVRMRCVDDLVLPELGRPFGALVIAFDPSMQRSTVEVLEDALMEAGADALPIVGGPGAEAWHGESWDSGLAWSSSPSAAIEFFFDGSGSGVDVTTFLVLVLDATDPEWGIVVDATRSALARPDWRLHAMAAAGRVEDVRRAIADGWPIDEFDHDMAETPLHKAVRTGHLEIVQMLLDAGADVNKHCEDRMGETPLGLVADKCSLDMARLLMQAGANPLIPGWMMISALDHAAARTDEVGKQVYALLKRECPRLE